MDSRTIGALPVARGRVGTVVRSAATSSAAFQSAISGLLARGAASNSRAQMTPTASPPATNITRSALDKIIHDASVREGVDESLVRAVVQAESGFRTNAVSKAGAMGLMQLMPATARGLGVKDPFDPTANVAGGTRFLRSMLDRFGSVPLALAAYNAGPGAVEKYGGVPPYAETKSYVTTVMQNQQKNQLALRRSKEGSGSDEQPVA